jgi:spore coat polysaccharide biosynthesis protein SpsF
MDKPKVVAIIQARMGSSRLPGKVLLPIAGKPLLWHIIYRLKKSNLVDDIAIATSNKPSDDPIEAFAVQNGLSIVRGSQDNVLERFAKAAEVLNPDVIVRVCGDSPLVDPGMIDFMIQALIEAGADYCTGEKGVPSIHEGFSPFTRSALKRLLDTASEDPVAIEHVTGYFKQHPDNFLITRVPVPVEHQFQEARISIDTPSDVRFIETVYGQLDVPVGDADMADVVKLLRAKPELLDINSHVYQKKATDKSLEILIRCDGDSRVGMGHVVRCLALAEELRDGHGCGITFAMGTDGVGAEKVKKEGFPLVIQNADSHEEKWLDNLIQNYSFDVLVFDIRTDLLRDSLRQWRHEGQFVVLIDDPSDRRLEADLAFYPPVPQVKRIDWTGFTGELYVGWEWVILRKEFSQEIVNKKSAIRNPQSAIAKVLVTMGGSDPQGMTFKAVKALELLEEEFEVVVVLGAGFQHKKQLDDLLSGCKHHFDVQEDVINMAELMTQSDLAVASFGVTAYELAAMGVPAIYLCLTEDHAESASAFVEADMAVCLGVFTHVSTEMMTGGISNILNNKSLLSGLANNARKYIDGQGVARISHLMIERFETGNE